jgi:REP element-mobilizing transposase RayT
MANTFTQLYIQYIFAVKFRLACIQASWKESLHKYITGIFQENRHKMLQINSMPDHIHILVGLNPEQSISSIIQNVKAESSKWINDRELTPSKFAWQQGYGAFSYSRSHLSRVIRYIQQQERHHRKQTFLNEYKSFLKAFCIEYDDRYIFKEMV